MKKLILSLITAVVLAGPAYALTECHLLYVASTTTNTDNIGNYFDGTLKAVRMTMVGYGTVGSTTWENADSPLAKSSAACATSLEQSRVILTLIQAAVQTNATWFAVSYTSSQAIKAAVEAAGTEWQDANATLDLILAAENSSGTALEEIDVKLLGIGNSLTYMQMNGPSSTQMAGIAASLTYMQMNQSSSTQAANIVASLSYLQSNQMSSTQAADILAAARASATSAELSRQALAKMTPGTTYSSTAYTVTSTESKVIVPGYPKLIKVAVKGTECATCYAGVAVQTQGEASKAGFVDADSGDYASPGVPIVIPLDGTSFTVTIWLDSAQAYDVKGSVSWQQ
jgi:hypothetical protein